MNPRKELRALERAERNKPRLNSSINDSEAPRELRARYDDVRKTWYEPMLPSLRKALFGEDAPAIEPGNPKPVFDALHCMGLGSPGEEEENVIKNYYMKGCPVKATRHFNAMTQLVLFEAIRDVLAERFTITGPNYIHDPDLSQRLDLPFLREHDFVPVPLDYIPVPWSNMKKNGNLKTPKHAMTTTSLFFGPCLSSFAVVPVLAHVQPRFYFGTWSPDKCWPSGGFDEADLAKLESDLASWREGCVKRPFIFLPAEKYEVLERKK